MGLSQSPWHRNHDVKSKAGCEKEDIEESDLEDMFSESFHLDDDAELGEGETQKNREKREDEDLESFMMSQPWWDPDQEDQKSKEKNTPDQANEASIDDGDNEEKGDVQGEDLESSLWGFDDEDLLRSVNLEDKA